MPGFFTYDLITKENKSCFFCTHRKVCGMYDALFDATTVIDDYSETSPDYDDKLYETLAENCRSFEVA